MAEAPDASKVRAARARRQAPGPAPAHHVIHVFFLRGECNGFRAGAIPWVGRRGRAGGG